MDILRGENTGGECARIVSAMLTMMQTDELPSGPVAAGDVQMDEFAVELETVSSPRPRRRGARRGGGSRSKEIFKQAFLCACGR